MAETATEMETETETATATATEASESAGDVPEREVCANGACMKTAELEANLDHGKIEEAEASLRERLSLSSEDARSLLGKLEYQRGNIEGALLVFEGVDFHAAIQKLLPPPDEKPPPRKGRPRPGSMQAVAQQPSSPVLEALYLKAKCLQKLGRTNEAAGECKTVLDSIEKMFPQGIPEVLPENKTQETLNQAAELLPELWKQAENYNEVIAAYRHALLSQWTLDNDCCARIQKRFAMFLLYSGLEAGPPNLAAQIEGSYIPRNNLEEAILLLMLLIRKYLLGKTKWDQSVMDHLGFAMSLCSQTSILAQKFEEVMPGVFPRDDRWKALALCYNGAGENGVAMNLLRKTLHKDENPNDLVTLLLAAKICSKDPLIAAEGVEYAQRAISNANGVDEHLKGVGLRLLGLCLGKQARVAPSDFERSNLLSEALKSLDGAIALEQNNPDLLFELAVQYAHLRDLNAAVHYAKQFTDATGGSMVKGWRLLAMVLSAQQRYQEAEMVIEAALDETAKWEQGPLFILKAQLKIAQSLPMDAIEIYRYLLALVQAQKDSSGSTSQGEDDRINEFEVWLGLTNLYSSLSHWKDAEICLEKAIGLNGYTVESLHQKGLISEGYGNLVEAMATYIDAVVLDGEYVPTLVLVSALMTRTNSEMLPVARSCLSDALKVQPTNSSAWYFLGVVHKMDGRISDAIDCFQAASILEESNPIEHFKLSSLN